jgi:hypothetical protein
MGGTRSVHRLAIAELGSYWLRPAAVSLQVLAASQTPLTGLRRGRFAALLTTSLTTQPLARAVRGTIEQREQPAFGAAVLCQAPC